MKRTRLREGRGLRAAGERATVVVDIVSSYKSGEGEEEEEFEREEGVEMRLGNTIRRQ